MSNALTPAVPSEDCIDLFQVSIGKGVSKQAIYWFTLTDRDIAKRVFEVLAAGLPGYMCQFAEVDAPPLPAKTIGAIELMQRRILLLLKAALRESDHPARAFLLTFAQTYAGRGLMPAHDAALRAIAYDMPADDEVYIPLGNARSAAALPGGKQ
ncbi:hypothetical protein [Pseudomonas nitroreducens]|uniref:hypothetical protein n=1 Tax=Pseudomonas nitroreducens TaxID=46680 RepID=UPI002D80D209|nr:hypothetical protein [Pseudomonas nitroreducens]